MGGREAVLPPRVVTTDVAVIETRAPAAATAVRYDAIVALARSAWIDTSTKNLAEIDG